MSSSVYGADLYTDFGGLARLRSGAREGTSDSKRAVAEQIEALFIGMMLKSMRAGAGGAAFAATGAGMPRDLYDAQIAQHLARGGRLGFADMMLRELDSGSQAEAAGDAPAAPFPAPERNMLLARRLWNRSDAVPAAGRGAGPAAGGLKPSAPAAANGIEERPRYDSPQRFVEALRPAAERAARRLGTAPEAVIAVAALETGWGRHMPTRADGTPSNNLFGIKAHGWDGQVARASTLEFEHGTFTRRVEPFRAYASPEEAVADFAEFVRSQPRYARALEVAGDPEAFLRGLHAAGYATDPGYGQKLVSILNSEPLRRERIAASAADGLG